MHCDRFRSEVTVSTTFRSAPWGMGAFSGKGAPSRSVKARSSTIPWDRGVTLPSGTPSTVQEA